MKYEDLTVAMLRQLNKERGFTLESKGKRFTKSQLIEALRSDNVEWEDFDESEECKRFFGEEKQKGKQNSEVRKPEDVPVDEEEKEKPWVGGFADTFKQIKQKYYHRKPMEIYKRNLVEGAMVVFIDVFETPSGSFVQKLRKAKVLSFDFETETVHVQMFYGEELDLSFDDLLYIKRNENGRFPYDISKFMRKKYSKNWKERPEYEDRRRERFTDSENIAKEDVRSKD